MNNTSVSIKYTLLDKSQPHGLVPIYSMYYSRMNKTQVSNASVDVYQDFGDES